MDCYLLAQNEGNKPGLGVDMSNAPNLSDIGRMKQLRGLEWFSWLET